MGVDELAELSPERAAEALVDAARDPVWLDRLAEALDEQLHRSPLARIISAWGLSNAEAGRIFGVTRQAIGGWLRRGVPAERQAAIADLAAVTDLLVHYLRRERIPAVVRRPAEELDANSMLDYVAAGRTDELLAYTREMFDFTRAAA